MPKSDDVYLLGKESLKSPSDLRDIIDQVVARSHARQSPREAEEIQGSDDPTVPMGDSRFGHSWTEWDVERAHGVPEVDILASTSTEALVHLLGSHQGRDRKLERNVIATELLNRLADTTRHAKEESHDKWSLWNIVVTSARRTEASRALAARSRALLSERREAEMRQQKRDYIRA